MVELLPLTPDDWPRWREARLRALADAPYAFGSTLADWTGVSDTEDRWRGRLATPGHHSVLALADKATVGMAGGVPGDTPGTVALVSMWVAPLGRGRGVGQALVREVLDWATSTGAHTVQLDVRVGNIAAIRLYERLGFMMRGEVPRDDPSEPLELRMTRPISERMSR